MIPPDDNTTISTITNLDFNMNDNTHADIQTQVITASQSLWSLVLRAMLQEGDTSAVASMDAVANGRAHVEVSVIFIRRGVALEGSFCSHGGRGNLFTITCMNPSEPPASDSDAVH